MPNACSESCADTSTDSWPHAAPYTCTNSVADTRTTHTCTAHGLAHAWTDTTSDRPTDISTNASPHAGAAALQADNVGGVVRVQCGMRCWGAITLS